MCRSRGLTVERLPRTATTTKHHDSLHNNEAGNLGWLGSRVVSVLDSGAEGPGFKLQPRRCRQTVHTHCISVQQAAKLVAALLRVARVTAGLVKSNGNLPLGLWLTSPTAKNDRSAPEPYAWQSSMGYLYLFLQLGLAAPSSVNVNHRLSQHCHHNNTKLCNSSANRTDDSLLINQLSLM